MTPTVARDGHRLVLELRDDRGWQRDGVHHRPEDLAVQRRDHWRIHLEVLVARVVRRKVGREAGICAK